jgi:hypothetical protein
MPLSVHGVRPGGHRLISIIELFAQQHSHAQVDEVRSAYILQQREASADCATMIDRPTAAASTWSIPPMPVPMHEASPSARPQPLCGHNIGDAWAWRDGQHRSRDEESDE